jgi:pyruvate formate lyase activating enzyme
MDTWTEDAPDKDTARGTVFSVQFFNLHDGPGTRTLVFFKGCPLSCQWCANPESMSRRPELGLTRSKCDGCGKCIDACPEQALSVDEGTALRIDRQRCNACGECIPACGLEALTIYGKEMTAREVFDEVYRDKMFYEGTGGGVTVSGGEPLLQPRFLVAVLELCRGAGIHTCLETTGYASREICERVLPLTDHVLFDLKHMDSRVHREFTGKANTRILENAALVAGSGMPVMFRIPLVPGFNDTLQNIGATAEFIKNLAGDNIQGLELMPYHRMGTGKYEALDKRYSFAHLQPPSPDYVESVKKRFEERGVSCTVSR